MYFLAEMNKCAEALNMKNTFYDSPHGLGNVKNVSCAHDVALLCHVCMKIPEFREICSTKYYEVKKGLNGNTKTYKWDHNHQLYG